MTDMSTGVANQDYLMHFAGGLIASGQIANYNIIFFNVHNFKYVNKVFSYEQGDIILRNYAQHIKNIMGNDEIVARLEKGTTKINGAYWDKIQKANGNVGYAPRETFDYETDYKLYLVPINTTNGSNNSGNNSNSNGNNSNNNSNNNENKYHNTVKVLINDEKKIIKVSPDAIAKDILEAFGGSVKITKADGSFLNGENDNMATNFIVKDTYTVIKKGDANADGIVNSFDYIRVMNYIMGRKQLNGYEKEAADANNDGIVNSFDYIRIMNYIMGTKKIELK